MNGYPGDNLNKTTDETLIRAFLAGDAEAFRQLVKRYEPVVVNTICGMLGPVTEVDDIAQETFIRFYRGLKNFRRDASLKTWVTRIAINQSIEAMKRRKRRRLFFQQEQPVDELQIADEHAVAGYDDTKEFLMKAIRKLDEKSRAVIVLRLIDGYSTNETAEILRVPIGTVLSRLARAQTKLLKLVKPREKSNDTNRPEASLSLL